MVTILCHKHFRGRLSSIVTQNRIDKNWCCTLRLCWGNMVSGCEYIKTHRLCRYGSYIDFPKVCLQHDTRSILTQKYFLPLCFSDAYFWAAIEGVYEDVFENELEELLRQKPVCEVSCVWNTNLSYYIFSTNTNSFLKMISSPLSLACLLYTHVFRLKMYFLFIHAYLIVSTIVTSFSIC